MSLTRIEVFLGRGNVEGQPMCSDAEGNVDMNGDGNGGPRAPVGGLLVQNGTFAWPPTVGVFVTPVTFTRFVIFQLEGSRSYPAPHTTQKLAHAATLGWLCVVAVVFAKVIRVGPCLSAKQHYCC